MEEARISALHRDHLILVVDDDELVRCSMEIMIGELRMQSVATASGEEALSRLKEGLQPDLVILDVNMPGMGGAGFLPLLRGLRPDVPVLLCTGRVDQTALDLAKTFQGVEIFPKPFVLSELSDRLSALPTRNGDP